MTAARLALTSLALVLTFGARQEGRALTEYELSAVKTAILDEIYDYGFHLILVVLCVFGYAVAAAQVYCNSEFGITVEVPNGVLLCPLPGDEHDHGPVFLLGPAKATDCSAAERRRSISIFASYNAVQDTKRLPDFLDWVCKDIGKARCQPLEDLGIAGLRSAAGTVKHSNGWIDVFVVTQAGTPDPAFDATAPRVNYLLGLHTNTENSASDSATFRTVLRAVRFSPPTQ